MFNEIKTEQDYEAADKIMAQIKKARAALENLLRSDMDEVRNRMMLTLRVKAKGLLKDDDEEDFRKSLLEIESDAMCVLSDALSNLFDVKESKVQFVIDDYKNNERIIHERQESTYPSRMSAVWR